MSTTIIYSNLLPKALLRRPLLKKQNAITAHSIISGEKSLLRYLSSQVVINCATLVIVPKSCFIIKIDFASQVET